MGEETEAHRGAVTFRVTQSVGSDYSQAPRACSSLHRSLGEPGSPISSRAASEDGNRWTGRRCCLELSLAQRERDGWGRVRGQVSLSSEQASHGMGR